MSMIRGKGITPVGELKSPVPVAGKHVPNSEKKKAHKIQEVC